jgi:hypothetical protein
VKTRTPARPLRAGAGRVYVFSHSAINSHYLKNQSACATLAAIQKTTPGDKHVSTA